MQVQDKKQFALLMGEMSAAFGKEANKETMAVYFNHLADYSMDAVNWGINKAIQTGERFPVIKTLRELANAYRPPVSRPVATEAVQIAEFTTEQVKDAKEEIQNIISKLSAGCEV